jgi:hypothetical protein
VLAHANPSLLRPAAVGYALGSNHTKCDPVTGPPCGFDTHYPNYFPARQGCSDAIKAMQEAGMRVIPYINGQLYDTRIPRWKEDDATASVQKFAAETMATNEHQPALSPHLEHFDGITSAVMCPHTSYWHGVMKDTMIKIVNEVGFDGVYVDQVGNGEQRNCADPTHNHTINGGSFWAEAFYSIMADVRAGVKQKSMFMTEGIVEEVSGAAFDIMLGLDWTELPLWHTIYGGWGYATGHATTGAGLASGLLTQLTDQFMAGGTMGWFTYQDQKDAFFDPANAGRVEYIQKLSQARIVAKAWMVHGRATRSVALNDPSGVLKGSCFVRGDDTPGETPSVACAVASAANSTSSYTLNMAPARYGLVVPPGSHVVLSVLMKGGASSSNSPAGASPPFLGTFASGSNITHSAAVAGYDVQVLKLEVHASAQ